MSLHPLTHYSSTHSIQLPARLSQLVVGAVMSGSVLLLPHLATATTVDRLSPSVETQVAQSRSIPATSAQSETLYLNSNRTYNYNLVVADGISLDGLFIPVGATIEGRYEPTDGGLRYVARTVQFNGQRYSLDAASEVLEDRKDPRDTSTGAIVEDAGIGAGGGAALGEIFGSIDLGEVLGGAAAGVAVGNLTADNVVVIEPEQTITLYSR